MTELSKKHNLTRSMAPYFDIHMIIPLLDFLAEEKLFDPKDIAKEKIKSILSTNMLDLVDDEYKKFENDTEMTTVYASQKDSMEIRKTEIFDLLDNEPADVQKTRDFFANEILISDLKSNAILTLDHLTTGYGISLESLENYYQHSKFKYECGVYKEGKYLFKAFIY